MNSIKNAESVQPTSSRWKKVDVVGGATLWTAFAASFGIMLAMG